MSGFVFGYSEYRVGIYLLGLCFRFRYIFQVVYRS